MAKKKYEVNEEAEWDRSFDPDAPAVTKVLRHSKIMGKEVLVGFGRHSKEHVVDPKSPAGRMVVPMVDKQDG